MDNKRRIVYKSFYIATIICLITLMLMPQVIYAKWFDFEDINKMVEEYKALPECDEKKALWNKIVASLPCGFCLGATMTTNYQQLKTMYHQRKHHKLKEWGVFCKWCESLPHFIELTEFNK